MNITTWNPFREIDALFDRYSRQMPRVSASSDGSPAEWAPSVDISESAKEYRIAAELPGVEKKDIKVGVENGVLTLSGERRFEDESKDAKQHRIERFYGQFTRQFTLPEDADRNAIHASVKDGVLKIRIPRSQPAAPEAKTINIQ